MDFLERYGPWAFIAGASEGTGAEFARHLAADGLNLVLVARREGPLAELAAALEQDHNIQCKTASIDLTHDDAAGQIADISKDLDIGLFIFNAGADENGSLFLDNAIENWDELVLRNVTTVMRSCHHFGRLLRTRQRGGIMVIGSGACYGGLPGVAVYGASKAFEMVLCEAMWAELQPHGIDVLHYVLGQTDTPAHRKLMEARGIPIPPDLADPADVARKGLALLSNGPVQNWGLDENDAGYAGTSAVQRRQRILAFAEMSSSYAKK